MAYIDKGKFLKKIAECFGHFGILVKAIEEIAEESTEKDVEKVVRCCTCKYSKAIGGIDCCCQNRKTPWFNDEFEVYMNLDDFCSYGTPKERGGEK